MARAARSVNAGAAVRPKGCGGGGGDGDLARDARGADVEQEAVDELHRLQRHDVDAIAVGVVLPAEVDDAVHVADEPVVRERDPVGYRPR